MYEHTFYIIVFVIWCRFHFFQNVELHYSESTDFVQNVRYAFTLRYRL